MKINTGSVFVNVDQSVVAVLAQTTANKFALIDLVSGNRWNNPVQVPVTKHCGERGPQICCEVSEEDEIKLGINEFTEISWARVPNYINQFKKDIESFQFKLDKFKIKAM